MDSHDDRNAITQDDNPDFQGFTRAGDIGFFEAGKRVLESHLVRHWVISLGILLLIILWPIGLFWPSIRFEPSRFVEEWIKLSVEGLFLFLLLEIMRYRSLSLDTAHSIQRLLSAYGGVLRALIASLTGLRETITDNNSEAALELLRSATSASKTLSQRLSDEFIQRLPEQLKLQMLKQRLELRPERCESILRSLRAAHRTGDYNVAELDELIQRYGRLLAALGISDVNER